MATLTYVKSRHFNKRRSRTKAISLGSPIEAVRHGSEMFALIAGDGSFNVVKSNGRIVRNVQPATAKKWQSGALLTTRELGSHFTKKIRQTTLNVFLATVQDLKSQVDLER